ncbi:ABC transporter permease [candidate division KSB3 bacterium]|uniref:ABC transporter permease n=1 Tax=candidate division KSB3 bacterium TaxID=2044937 RepID=A0A9D5JZD4_9BACT|nr:ABC transporter permease [candidate division KSB3 bacterium]MBD3327023.1 ABC transporter permease [candidate division KSB3 bacterium]
MNTKAQSPSKSLKEHLQDLPSIYISLFVLFILVLILYIGNPSFLSVYNLKTVANSTTVLLGVGLGQAFVILTGGIDLSVGGVMSLISVVYILGLAKFGLLAFPLVLIVSALAGLLNGFILTRFRIPSFVTTLGTGGIFVSLTYLLSAAPLTPPSSSYKYLDIINGSMAGIKNGWILAIIVFAVYFILQNYTYLGRSIYAIGSNEKMCWMSGIAVKRTKMLAFMFSGLGAGISGMVLASNLYSGYPSLGEVYILESIAVVVVGGTALTGGAGGALNTLIGALIMSVIKNGMMVVGIDVYAQQTFLGVLIVIAVALTFDRSKLIIIK